MTAEDQVPVAGPADVEPPADVELRAGAGGLVDVEPPVDVDPPAGGEPRAGAGGPVDVEPPVGGEPLAGVGGPVSVGPLAGTHGPEGVERTVVVAIGGVPGSGKSTLGRALAARLGAALLDLDTLTNPLLARIAELVGAGDNLDHPLLRGAVRTARYQCLRDTAAEIAAAGCPVVAVAPFTAELADPVAWQDFSTPLSVSRPALVQTLIDPEVALARRARRGLPRDADFVPPTAVESTTVSIRADGATDADTEAARIVRLLGTAIRG